MGVLELHGEVLVSDEQVVIAVLDDNGDVFAQVVLHEQIHGGYQPRQDGSGGRVAG